MSDEWRRAAAKGTTPYLLWRDHVISLASVSDAEATAQSARLQLWYQSGEPAWMAAESLRAFVVGARKAAAEVDDREVIRAASRAAMGDESMWRERAEAAEAEVRMLRGTLLPREMVEASEVYSLAVRIVALSAVYSSDVINRALAMLRDAAVRAEDEDGAALHNIIRVIERRADPETWHAQIERDRAAD